MCVNVRGRVGSLAGRSWFGISQLDPPADHERQAGPAARLTPHKALVSARRHIALPGTADRGNVAA